MGREGVNRMVKRGNQTEQVNTQIMKLRIHWNSLEHRRKPLHQELATKHYSVGRVGKQTDWSRET